MFCSLTPLLPFPYHMHAFPAWKFRFAVCPGAAFHPFVFLELLELTTSWPLPSADNPRAVRVGDAATTRLSRRSFTTAPSARLLFRPM